MTVTTSYTLLAVSLGLLLAAMAILGTWSRLRELERLNAELRHGLYTRLSALETSLKAAKNNLLFKGDDTARLLATALHVAESIPRLELKLPEPDPEECREVQDEPRKVPTDE